MLRGVRFHVKVVCSFPPGDGLQFNASTGRTLLGIEEVYVDNEHADGGHGIDDDNDHSDTLLVSVPTPSAMGSRRQSQSPPKAIVDASPLQPAMDRNKECKCLVCSVRAATRYQLNLFGHNCAPHRRTSHKLRMYAKLFAQHVVRSKVGLGCCRVTTQTTPL